MAEASPSSGAQADSEAGGGKQEEIFQKGVPVAFTGPLLSIVPSSNDFCQFPAFRTYTPGEVQAGSS